MNPRSAQLGLLDYLLSFIASGTVLVSAGISVRNDATGWVLLGISAVGHLYAAFGPRPTWTWNRLTVDGVLFTLCAFACVAFSGPLNATLPAGGFPATLLYTAGLAWAMAVCSFFSWRDSTLLFLAVPAIALFGLIGAFDTFQLAPLMFFLFLVCTGTLFARAHLRTMLRFAELAGEPSEDRLRRYAWRSIAGPEWALTSAIGIISISALGAPVIRSTVQDATSPLRVPLRNVVQSTVQNTGFNGGRPDPNQRTVRVGQGPFGRPSETPIMVATLPSPIYLRGEAYYSFEEGRWSAIALDVRTVRPNPDGLRTIGDRNGELQALSNRGKSIPFQISGLNGPVPGPYVPGVTDLLSASPEALIGVREDGILRARDGFVGPQLSGVSRLVNPPDNAKGGRPGYWLEILDEPILTGRTRELARQVVKGARSDLEIAKRLTALVTSRIRYNLQAPAIAPERDTVDTVLFETREGYCDLFATSLALLAREQGLASRVAVGYLVTASHRQADGTYLIREADYHMWTEIYFRGYGWIPFDATEGADSVPGGERGSAWSEPTPWYQSALVTQIGNILLITSVIGVFAVAFWESLRRFSSKRGGATQAVVVSPREGIARASRFLADVERATTHPRLFPETVSEYLERVQMLYPQAGPAPASLGTVLNRLMFASDAHDMADSMKALDDAKPYLEALRKARTSS